ncbi:MAG: riboflavin biosynthesis protein RibF [Spirochaetales bacterium]|nr:riboflavin biosynthesis protein RibF [Spirochaetales bacterium]
MEYIDEADYSMKNTIVAFGCFDGLHQGHRMVLNSLMENKEGCDHAVILSLDTICSELKGDIKVIYTEEEKAGLLKGDAADAMVSLPLDAVVLAMEAEDFVKTILIGKFDAKKIVAGENLKFGKDRAGDIALLEELSGKYGYELIRCATVEHEGREITSDWIKIELEEGDLKKANELLGHPFTIFGEVVHGKALGRTVGMPTANLKVPDSKIMPKFGVYGSLSEIESNTVKGLTNIGRRPSVDDHSYVTIETFLIDFASDIYGEQIALELYAYIRGVVKFPNLEAVKKQVDKDLQVIRSELDRVFIA